MTEFSSLVLASVIADVTKLQAIVRSRQARNILGEKIAKEFELNHSFIKAVIAGDIESVQVLLKEGANVNFIEGRGDTALLIAVYFGYENMVRFLVDNGANVNFVKDITGDTALHCAANQGYQKIVEFLVDNGANVNLKVIDGDTAIFLALDKGYDEIVEFLFKRGADVDINAIDGRNQAALIRFLGRKKSYNEDQIKKAIDVLKNKEQCPISFEHMTLGSITITNCNHAFNSDCLVQWFSQSSRPKCPLCRKDIKNKDVNNLFFISDGSITAPLELTPSRIRRSATPPPFVSRAAAGPPIGSPDESDDDSTVSFVTLAINWSENEDSFSDDESAHESDDDSTVSSVTLDWS